MLVTSHAIAGSLIGLGVNNPPLAFGLAIGAHLLMDKVPHVWSESKKHMYLVSAIDVLFSFGFVGYLFWHNPSLSNSVAFGALGGAGVAYLLVGIPYFFQTKLGQWHVKRQPHHSESIYWLPDAIFLIASVIGYFLVIK